MDREESVTPADLECSCTDTDKAKWGIITNVITLLLLEAPFGYIAGHSIGTIIKSVLL